VTVGELAALAAGLLEDDVAEWQTLLEEAVRRGTEEDALLRLGAILGAAPGARPGPRLGAALDGLTGHLYDAREEAERRSDRSASARLLLRVLRAEATLYYDVDPTRTPSQRLTNLVDRTLILEQSWSSADLADLTLTGLRVGSLRSGRSLATRTDKD